MAVRKGYKQSPEHIARRIKSGAEHPRWQGDDVSERGGRARALRHHPNAPCEECGSAKAERHHVDGNTADNRSDNIRMLCRRCHMAEDGRLEAFRAMAVATAKDKIDAAARARRARTLCKRGHPLSGENLYVTPEGKRVCKTCRRIHKQNARGQHAGT